MSAREQVRQESAAVYSSAASVSNAGEAINSGDVLVVDGLAKAYGSGKSRRAILGDLSLSVPRREFVSIVGPSGIGKTTLLRCLSGLSRPSAGRILIDGRPLTEPRAEIAVVSQDYSRSLLPWLRVEANVALPLRQKRVGKSQLRRRSLEALSSVGLENVARLYPWQLSGGMQQRVAIARALAYEPELLLMDEPFASVDAQTRLELEDLLLRVHQENNLTSVLVTHDIEEAVYLSTQVVVLAGKPAVVAEQIPIQLGSHRNQIETRSRPAFVEYRNRILIEVRAGAVGLNQD